MFALMVTILALEKTIEASPVPLLQVKDILKCFYVTGNSCLCLHCIELQAGAYDNVNVLYDL